MVSNSFLLQGNGDSEIALVVEDNDMMNSTMNGVPYPVARFAATLRRQLYKGNILLSLYSRLVQILIVGIRAPWSYSSSRLRQSSPNGHQRHASSSISRKRHDTF